MALFSIFFQLLFILFNAVFALFVALIEGIAGLFEKTGSLSQLTKPTIEVADYERLTEEVTTLALAAKLPDADDFIVSYARHVGNALRPEGIVIRSQYILHMLLTSGWHLYETESLDKPPPSIKGLPKHSPEAGLLSDRLIARRKKLIDPEHTVFKVQTVSAATAIPTALLALR